MLRWIARFLLFRFLPRRLLPIITVIEIARFLRGLRRPPVGVNDPRRSRTGRPRPPRTAGTSSDFGPRRW